MTGIFTVKPSEITGDFVDMLKTFFKDRELVRTQTEEYIEKLEEEGMTVTYPDLEEFKAATSTAVDVFTDTYDAKLLDKIR